MTLARASFGDAVTDVDVLVVGGGITGAALAYEAASRGLSVALVEKGDFGGATSAATGKLIHGGLRYLKRLDVALVRESLAERRTLMRIAPNLVAPIAMVLPEPGLVERLGLTAYDVLSFDRNRTPDPAQRIPAHRILGSHELAERGLPQLHRGALFHDAMMPAPERLTLAFVRSAARAGALVAHRVRVTGLRGRSGVVEGAEVVDEVSGATGEIRARVVVNAAGPWARDLLLASPLTEALAGPPPRVRSEGIYLVTRELSRTMVLTVSGHGHFSFAPWRGHSLVGPTETPYHGEVDDWRLTRASIERFVAAINASGTVPRPLALDDVVAAYGGLRPLTEHAGDDTYTASRASELVDHVTDGVSGLVSATGGKYTNSRAFAEKAVDRIARGAGRPVRRSETARHTLAGCIEGTMADAVAAASAQHRALAADTVTAVVGLYGADASAVLSAASADPALARRATTDGVPLAAVVHSARHEAPETLADLLLRRTAIGTLGDPGDDVLTRAAALAAAELGWDAARTAREVSETRTALSLPTE